MVARTPGGVNLPAVLILTACAPAAVREPGPPGFASQPESVELRAQVGPAAHGALPAFDRPFTGHLGDLPPDPVVASLDDEGSILLQLAPSLENASVAEDGGEAIDEALAAFSNRKIDTYGAGLLTQVQVFGDPFHASICEAPELDVTVEDSDGNPWSAALSVPQYTPFVGDPEAVMGSLSAACEAGVAAAAGDVDAAVAAGDCQESDLHQFFEPGGDCRTCVEASSGDFAACEDAGSCSATAPTVTWVTESGEKAWYQVMTAVSWACRPDWLAPVYLLGHLPADGTLPPSYDHADWNYFCFPLYDAASDSVTYVCDAGDSPERGSTLGEGVYGRTLWMENDRGERGFALRNYYTPRVDLKAGNRLRWSWANSSNIGRLSKPVVIADTNGDGVTDLGDEGFGYPADSWGINPHELRPDGADPTSLDDTYARDWLAILALKTATTMDGISILTSNHSRCAAWGAPDAEGSATCLEMDPPSGQWMDDALHFGKTLDDGQTYSYAVPITTIGSTGLPDPDVPGGIVPLVAGTARLADTDWDNCQWARTFVPDAVPFPDTAWDYEAPASLVGDSYRFGKDPDLDLRVVLNTNIARHYCGEGEP